MFRRRSSTASSADAIVAATAGEDCELKLRHQHLRSDCWDSALIVLCYFLFSVDKAWKTWAGRSLGTSEFQWMDIIRGSKRTIERSLRKANQSNISTCPVCYCEPDEWYMTNSCCHAVCMDCLRAYASSQINDPLHHGPLKCPVCPQPLRRKDAVVALSDSPDLVQKWDEKLRNQLLRALPSYRPCPKCSSKSESVILGGGFVTSECLAPQYEERQEQAQRILRLGSYATICCFGLVVLFNIWISNFPSTSPLADLFCMLLPLVLLRPNIKHVRSIAASQSRQALFQPIKVDCPCCDGSFILPASTTNADIVDAESKKWMDRHSRRCPSCSAPISKNGGCNHITCQNCKANFCWACMRLRTSCRAYQCHNGAEFGNAVPGLIGNVANANAEDSLLNRIDTILSNGRPSEPPLWQNGLVLLTISARNIRIVQRPMEWVMIVLASLFASGLSSMVAIAGVTAWNLHRLYTDQRNREREGPHGQVIGGAGLMAGRNDGEMTQRGSATTAAEFLLGVEERNQLDRERNVRNTFRTEAEMVREAMRRSLVEQ